MKKYESLKKALSDNGLIKDRNSQVSELESNIASLFQDKSKLPPSIKAGWAISDAIENIDSGSAERTDIQNYFRLLFECQKICVHFSYEREKDSRLSAASLGEHGTLEGLKKVLSYPKDPRFVGKLADQPINTPTTQDDILFTQLYLMGKQALGEEAVKPILLEVVNTAAPNEPDTKTANAKILLLAQRAFLQAKNESDKEPFLDIIIAHQRKVCDPRHIPMEKQAEIGALVSETRFGLRSNTLSLQDVFWYDAHSALEVNAADKSYYEGLKTSLSALSKSGSLFFPQPMKEALDDLIIHSNKLYLDDTVEKKLKANCKELLGLLSNFNKTISSIKNEENIRKHNLPVEAGTNPVNVAELRSGIEAQVNEITQKITEFSKDAEKSPHWGRILGLGLLTLGIGLLIVSAIFGTEFFKREHPIATQARQLITEGQTAIKLSHTGPPPSVGESRKLEF